MDDILLSIIEEDFVIKKSDKSMMAVLALGHGVTDLYANFLPALLPFFEDTFSLSKTMISLLIFAIITSGSLCQVLYGSLGDKWGRKLFLVPGPAVAAIFMSFIGLSPNFLVLLILLLLGGVGVSAFHPHAASITGDIAGSKRGFGISIFMTGGTVGYAAGPLIAAVLLSRLGAGRIPLTSIVGIIASFLLYKYVITDHELHKKRNSTSILQAIKPHFRILALLSGIVVLRATVSIVFSYFISFLMNQQGKSLEVGGGAIFFFLLSISLGTLTGGYLSDKISRRKLIFFSMLFSAPFFFIMVHSTGFMLFACLLLSGAILGLSNPVPLTIAQELIPDGASTASSIMMGFSWGLAGLLALPFGMLSDQFGGDVVPAMSIAAALPIIAAMLSLFLPRK